MDENNFDLRLVTQTLNDEITAFIRRWEQAEVCIVLFVC